MTEKLIIWLLFGAGALIAAGLVFHGIRQGGVEAERERIETQDRRAGDAATDARARYDACPPGMYDFKASVCRRAP